MIFVWCCLGFDVIVAAVSLIYVWVPQPDLGRGC